MADDWNMKGGLEQFKKEEYILDPWQEAVGVLQAYHLTGTTLVLEFPHMVVRVVGDEDSFKLMEVELRPDMVGQRIGIILTDLPDRPLVVAHRIQGRIS